MDVTLWTWIIAVAGLVLIGLLGALQLVAVVGPRRRGNGSHQLQAGEVENLRKWAIQRAENKYGLLGYEIDLSNCRAAAG